MSVSTFDTTKTNLEDLLKDIQTGKMQLPDFQRGWVWDDNRILSLLASLSVSFPIGAVMLLETGGKGVNFKPRPVEGSEEHIVQKEPEILILDGQQRFTSLYQALMLSKPVKTKDAKNKPIKRWYYFDMKKVLTNGTDREDAILSIPGDKVVRTFGRELVLDLTGPNSEYENDLFPVNKVFESATWRNAYQDFWDYDKEKIKLFNAFEQEIIKRFEKYLIPVIELKKATPKEAVCLVFEKVNTGGVSLTVFELLTASFAAENYQLRDDWRERQKRLKGNHQVLRSIQSDDFLQVISLLVTQTRRRDAINRGDSAEKIPGISCKRRDILRLEVNDYKEWADKVEEGFIKAARFLHTQNIFRAKDLPYRTQLVPLAAILIDLDEIGQTEGARNKIARWYWCGVLGELYGGAIESRFARDLPEVASYVRGDADEEPITIRDANFAANRLLTLRTRNSAAYKGIYALLMRSGCLDFRTGETIETQTFFDDAIDIHHIFPQKWCKTQEIGAGFYNSIINKTAISARTNRKIGGNAPSKYLETLEENAEIDRVRMIEILESHGIDGNLLYSDHFWHFFEGRGEALLQHIENAMDKPIARDPDVFRSSAPEEIFEDEEWDENTWTAQEELPEMLEIEQDNLIKTEDQFHQAMINVYETAKLECNYNASYFLRMVSEHGGLEAAKRLLATTEPSEGFTTLWVNRRLDLTVEAHVIKPDYQQLFTTDEIAIAEQRLIDVEYKFDA